MEMAKQQEDKQVNAEQEEVEKLLVDTAAIREQEVAVKADREKQAADSNAAHDEEMADLQGQMLVYKELCAELEAA